MGLRINTNVTSMVAQRNLNNNTKALDKTLNKLSSGERITSAADDAAGLAISEKLKAQIRGNEQATRNSNDGISLIQTAEGGMNEVSNILNRLRELSIQSASDTIGNEERQFIEMEFQALKSEVDRIANVTTFNGHNLLNGVGETLDFQVGLHNNAENDRISYSPQATDVTTGTLQLSDLSVGTKDASRMNLETLDKAISTVSGNRAVLGALQNRLQSTITNLTISRESMSAANSRIRDADMAVETSELTKRNVLGQAGTAVLANANSSQQSALALLG